MKPVDVLIVGGGPAGSTLAWALRDSGLSVAILDKRDFPRDKVCAGWVTPAVMEELEVDLDDYARERTLQPISGFRLGLMGEKEVETRYEHGPVSYGIRRYEFDDYLLRRAADTGATLLTGTPFRQMEREDDGWRVNGEIAARVVVGAGGHFCPVARAMGARPGRSERIVAAQEIEFPMTPEQAAACPVDPEVPELFFTRDLAGYGWIFRKGDYLNIGLGREDNHQLSRHVAEFTDYLKAQSRIPADTPEKFHGHAYLLYPHALRRLVDDGRLLIGDAAGLAYPQSGEGIRPAVESALLAAQSLLECDGRYTADRLAGYVARMEDRFGRRQAGPGWLERVPVGLKQPIAARLMRSPWFARNVVMDRWFLHTHQAPLRFRAGTAA